MLNDWNLSTAENKIKSHTLVQHIKTIKVQQLSLDENSHEELKSFRN